MRTQKLFWASNLKHLRNRKKLSQDDLAVKLEISRVKLNAHENGVSKNPPLEDLLKIADFFNLAIDTLLKVDLTKITELKLRELEAGNDLYISGGKIRVLSITVNTNNRENIEFVPLKAKAGYLSGFNDMEYIAGLPKFNLPYLPENKTYRMFPTEGDSMLPIPENCMVITQYVADWNDLKKTRCVVILKNEQTFLFKEVTTTANRTLLLHSLNPAYQDQEIFVGDVLEVWEYHSHVTDVLPTSENSIAQILTGIKEIKSEISRMVH